jgi:hypothetical protein
MDACVFWANLTACWLKASALNVRHHGNYSSALNHLRRALGLPRVDMAEMAQCDACHKWRYVTAGTARVLRTAATFVCADVRWLCSKPDDYEAALAGTGQSRD